MVGRKAAVAALFLTLVLVPVGAGAQTFVAETIHRYDVDIRIERDGSIVVRETIDYDFGTIARHGIFRDVPTTLRYDDTYDRIYPLDVLSVTGSPGTPVGYEVSDAGGTTHIRIGDPDRTITGDHTYRLEYRIRGVMNAFSDHDELYWNAIGAQWTVPIDRASVRVSAPGPVERVACFAGPVGSTLRCERGRVQVGVGVFSQRDLSPYEALTVVAGLRKGIVAEPRPILRERWSLARAFDRTPVTWSAFGALMVLALGGFGWLAWRTGRDRRYVGSPVDVLMGAPAGTPEQDVPLLESGSAPVEFAPPADLRPGQVGTLIDEVANPLDVTATIVDLAVRRYLVIEEIEKKGWFGKPDWRLRRLREADAELLEYERRVLDGLFEDGDEVLLSSLKTRFVGRLQKVEHALYRDAVARGWFVGRPDTVRQRWATIGAVVLVVALGVEAATIAWTHLALVPIPLVALGLLLLIGAKWMPRRTPKGTGLVRRVRGFRTVIATAETHMARWAEQENVFTRYLPFAIVFGLTDKWAKAFEGLAAPPQDMSWYVSTRPFVYAGFAHAMDGFAVTTAGTISSTPSGSGSSGFGGGGFSGGGGGGGGGGSW